MNLSKLFETQRKLDNRIVKEKGLEGQDLLPEKILALQVELGELANEWRGFKFWSENQEPHRVVTNESMGCDECAMNNRDKDPLLEEYVDCLHFILSVGLSLGVAKRCFENYFYPNPLDVTDTFSQLYQGISSPINIKSDETKTEWYEDVVAWFIDLGDKFGFTWDQIESAYFEKNRINHARQENGY